MSFTLIQQATPRLHRSELAVPGSNPSLFEKAAKGGADIIFLDLEDAVPPDLKAATRPVVREWLGRDFGGRERWVRMNPLATGLGRDDVAETIAWYANPGSTAVNGNVVRVCGQMMLGA